MSRVEQRYPTHYVMVRELHPDCFYLRLSPSLLNAFPDSMVTIPQLQTDYRTKTEAEVAADQLLIRLVEQMKGAAQ